MKIIPAVDIKEGRCVRLSQGKADQETVYSDDPVAMACHWDEEGAPLIHVVDLDGAFDGQPANAETVKQIIYNSSVDIQVGGGIRNLKTIEAYIKAGAFRVILGTIAQKEPEFVAEACREFPGKIIVGIDARDGNVAIKGWVEVSDQRATDLAQKLESYGVAGYIFTDISRDGMLQGPNLKITDNGQELFKQKVKFVSSFGGVEIGAPLIYINGILNLAIGINQGDIAMQYEIKPGPDVLFEIWK